MFDVNDLAKIKVGLASPEKIREWSHGEVTKAETINYRSQKPEMDGLFCEKIFGPAKDYECHCGKYKKQRYAGVVCEKCGVEVITKDVRRERMGHIELASPCSHIWYLKGIPSRMALVLKMSAKELEEIVYYSAHVCLNPGKSLILKEKMYLDDTIARSVFQSVIEEIIDGNEEKGGLLPPLDKDGFDAIDGKELLENLKNPKEPFSFFECTEYITGLCGATFGEGAEAVKTLLKNVDLEKEFKAVKEEINAESLKSKKDGKTTKSSRYTQALKRLEVLNAFISSKNKPEWMILDALPVIPPDLRPMLQLDGNRFAASDANELYRRIITRNNRLKKLIDMNAPYVILINEKRMLQEAVDALIDNGRRNGKAVTGGSKGKVLKSLSANLKGKQGRFRQNLLGKRVDYSGRSVIAIGPQLKMYQCGIPREMAINLLRPFIVAILFKEGKGKPADCDKKVDNKDADVYDVVEKIISKHPVLLNRAPTLHRLGIQAFQPVLVEGRAIRLHPLVCTGFNADFDGDQMAVHVPIGKAAQEEAVDLMLASNNILAPKDGKPIVTPGQDILIGNYYLTMEANQQDFENKAKKLEAVGDFAEANRYREFAKCEGKVFKDMDEVVKVYEEGLIHLHTRIALRGNSMKKNCFTEEMNNSYLITTVGKVIFNFAFPSSFPYINGNGSTKEDEHDLVDNLKETLMKFFVPKGTNIKEYIASLPTRKPIVKGDVNKIIDQVYHVYGVSRTSAILDKLKDQGYKYSTISGLTVAISDINVIDSKDAIVKESDEKVTRIEELYSMGFVTNEERHNQINRIWKEAFDKVQDQVKKTLHNDTRNPLFIMWNSGARGSDSNFTQLMGMRGSMANTKGETIEIPVKSCFREGLNVSEFFTGTHGARKGGADTALKTADSGYLTRRLVDVSQDVIVRELDCHSDHGTVVRAIKDPKKDKPLVDLKDRIVGRFACHDIINPKTQEIIVEGNTLITDKKANAIIEAGIEEVEIRSLFGCETKDGVCQHCYGLNLATGEPVAIGEAVGIMAAQSIGEPGTQLTMRTFHSGGVATAEDITQGLPRVQELLEARNPKGQAVIARISGYVTNIEPSGDIYRITVQNENESFEHETLTNPHVVVKVGDYVNSGDKLVAGNIAPKDLLKYSDVNKVEDYIVSEVHKVYRSQNIAISDKHIEVIVRQMLRKVVVVDGGDTDLIPGARISIAELSKKNEKVLLEGKNPAVIKPLVLGITKAALETESFLSAASFQETTRVLTDAAIKGKVDCLHGLKENVITGKLIPAGRGLLSQAEKNNLVDNFDVTKRMSQVRKQYIGVHDVDYGDEEEDSELDNLESLCTERSEKEQAETLAYEQEHK